MQRIVAFILALVLTVPAFGVVGEVPAEAASTTEEVRATVTKAYEELLAITSPGEDGASDGAMQLLNHAISGGGKDLIMDATDNYTGMILRSNLYREGFIEGLTSAFDRLVHNYENKMLVGGSYQFYEHKMNYSNASYQKFGEMLEVDQGQTGQDSLEQSLSSNRLESLKSVKDWTGTKNSYDDAMILVNGTCSNRFTIEKAEAAEGVAKYHVSLIFWDNFDFGSGNYKGDDAQLAKALTWFGKLLAMGGAIKMYHLEVHLEFDITFGNECPHQTQSYRWEDNGTDLVAVSGDGFAISDAKRIDSVSSTTGEPLNPYYKLEKGVHLYHDRPWVVEFRGKNNTLYLGPGTTYAHGTPYLLKTSATYVGGVSFKYAGISQTTGKETALTGRYQYGVDFVEAGFKNGLVHTYRLENRVSGASNMVYLVVDGEDLGPMNNFYINKSSKNELQPEKVDWFNGKDIVINYINNTSFRYNPKYPLEYLQIWENGEGNAPHAYYYNETVAPTCTGKGYTAHICAQCGDVWKDNFVEAKSHQYGAYVPEDDAMHVQTCAVCGEKHVEAHSWGAPQINGMQAAYQCTVCKHVKVETLDKAGIQGKWETDFVMKAAELGVSATDSVLRCTFDFQKDGTVSTSWKAVDLTALRIYFRDMFVSAYYAMAYGSGITDLQQVEAYCVSSTGMGVSAYMDTIVTEEAIKNAFTPASDKGAYMVNEYGSAVYLDLNIMDVSSDLGTPNPYTIQDDIMRLNAASFGQPEYTFVCNRKN